ncbi:MAG: hypothetical protein ACOC22_01390 [bacterium]
MKDIRDSINKLKTLNEGQLKVGDNLYDLHKNPDGQIIFVGENGILGKDNKLIDWETIRELMFKYNKA